MKKLVVLAVLAIAFPVLASANEFQMSAAVSSHPIVNSGPAAPSHDCAGLKARLIALQSKLSDLHSNMLSVVTDAATVDSSWYGQLSQNYGQTVYIPEGVYDAINQSAQTEQQNAATFSSDSNAVNTEMTAIIADLSSCKFAQ